MAVSASFTRLRQTELRELVNAAASDTPKSLEGFLLASGVSVVEFPGDPDIFSVLFPILAEDYDIDLETSENGVVSELAEACDALVVILTLEEQERYLESLAPEQFSVEDLADAYEDFTEDDQEGAGAAMLGGITALYQALQEVDDRHVVVVMIS